MTVSSLINLYNITAIFLSAIDDGCSVKGYTAWSLLDNFEWARGYSEKFGLHYVDFNDPNRPRKVKRSATWFRDLIRDNGFPKTKSLPPVKDSSATVWPVIAIIIAGVVSSLLVKV